MPYLHFVHAMDQSIVLPIRRGAILLVSFLKMNVTAALEEDAFKIGVTVPHIAHGVLPLPGGNFARKAVLEL